ncbi:uncharacterized protein [Epargyreus clarus]|uniref:uncharacterized protein n=1 Tax=Epargyreus clarus TaxID=520877 RepID=UPI003C2ECD87
MLQEAFLAGLWASIGSCLGKLSGAPPAFLGTSYLISGVLLILMVLANTWGCRHYLRSLDAATNSVKPTVISAASTYVLSGIIGLAVFEEDASWRWWVGAMLITAGLTLVARPRHKVDTKQHTE